MEEHIREPNALRNRNHAPNSIRRTPKKVLAVSSKKTPKPRLIRDTTGRSK
jgi:hypothetical protein